MQPLLKPINLCFSSGPTAKRPGWSPAVLEQAFVGRSHRSPLGVTRIRQLLNDMRNVLQIPNSHLIAMVAGSATGAMEMAMWNFLGARGADSLAWDIFGQRWQDQMKHSLQLSDLRCLNAPEGLLPPLNQVDFDRDVVFLWNGSTAGVRVPNGDWISQQRRGLTICDATSAAFTINLPWTKLDVTVFSWQKGLGGEAAHGMIVLSPAAVARLTSYQPPWPIPGLYRLNTHNNINQGLFNGLTTNTPSMLCVEDCLDALNWAKSIGGLDSLVNRSRNNLSIVQKWLSNHRQFEFLCVDPANLSSSTICIKSKKTNTDVAQDWLNIRRISDTLASSNVAYDCHNHTSASPALRLWGGPTVTNEDMQRLLPWIDHITKD